MAAEATRELVEALTSLTTGNASQLHSPHLNEQQSNMLAYALKLTVTPQQVESSDVESLRSGGFCDQAIHDICAITGYFAFVNRIADGLGVELESDN